MGGEPIKLTELRLQCIEINWHHILVLGATLNQGLQAGFINGLKKDFSPFTNLAVVLSVKTTHNCKGGFPNGDRKVVF